MRVSQAATPVALVVLAIAATTYAYFVDRGTVSDADRSARNRDLFPSFRVEDVRRIELTHGSEVLVLERAGDAGDRWSLTSPLREPANAAAVDALVRELEMATRLRDVEPADAMGFEAPRVLGRATVGPIEYRFALGAEAPRPEGAAYMRVEGEGMFVVGRSAAVQLLRGADAYRDRSLVPYGASAIARLEVTAGSDSYVLQRSGASFRAGGAAGLRAARAEVDRIFASLSDVRAEGFVENAIADRATATPTLVLRVTPRDADAAPVRLRVGEPCPSGPGELVVVRDEPTRVAACVAKAAIDGLRKTPDALVDRSPFYARADEIEEVAFEPVGNDGPRVALARRGTGWHERSPEDRDLDSDAIDSANDLAAALANASALEARPAGGVRVAVRTRLTIVRTGDGQQEVVEVGPRGSQGNTLLARRAEDGALLSLDAATSHRFEPHPIAVEGRAVWRTPFDPASVVGVDDGCDDAHGVLRLVSGVWTARKPARGPVTDGAAIDRFVDALVHTRAQGWVAEGDDGTFGFSGAGGCTVVLALDGDDAAMRRAGVVFGAEAEGGIYARTLDDPAVFVAPKTLREIRTPESRPAPSPATAERASP